MKLKYTNHILLKLMHLSWIQIQRIKVFTKNLTEAR